MNKSVDKSESNSRVKIKWHLPKSRKSAFLRFEAFNGKTREVAPKTRNQPLIYQIFTLKNILGMEIQGPGHTQGA